MRSLLPVRNQFSCGDKISSCRRQVQVGNSHPHGKTCSSRLLWRQDFILSGKCKLETRTHMGKIAATIQMVSPRLSLWRQDFILSILQVENLQPHGKTCSHGLKTCTHESLGTQLFSDSFMPGNGAFSEAAQAQPKGSINMPVPCLQKPRGPGAEARPHRHCYPQILRRSLKQWPTSRSCRRP